MATRDVDIREALKARPLEKFWEEQGSEIVPELGVCRGKSFVDIAVINSKLYGYEIKSSRDTLARLPGQMKAFSAVLDQVTLVTAPSHLDEARELIPDWWGIRLAKEQGGSICFNAIRDPEENPDPDSLQIALLMWKDEILSVLEELGLDRGYRSKTKKRMAKRLVQGTDREELSQFVRDALKAREDWRSADQPSPSVERSPLLPMFEDFPD
jgi:hypothetical protein